MYIETIPDAVALKVTHSPSSNEQKISHLVCYCNFEYYVVLRYFLCLSVILSRWLCLNCYRIKIVLLC